MKNEELKRVLTLILEKLETAKECEEDFEIFKKSGLQTPPEKVDELLDIYCDYAESVAYHENGKELIKGLKSFACVTAAIFLHKFLTYPRLNEEEVLAFEELLRRKYGYEVKIKNFKKDK